MSMPAQTTPPTYDVVIIGAGLTGLATAQALSQGGLRVAIVEKGSRLGGVIQTEQQAGFTLEQGPSTGIISTPEVAHLLNQFAGLKHIASTPAKRRLILKTHRGKQRFLPLPSSPLSGITTPLFSWRDKLRVLGEPFRPVGTSPEESVASLVRRRLGHSILDYAVNPFISGIYAGDPETLVTRYALPKLYALEHGHGSFIRGALAKARQRPTATSPLVTKEIFSMKGGLSTLIEQLASQLPPNTIYLEATDCHVQGATDDTWQIHFKQGDEQHILQTSHVVTTVTASALPSLLPFLSSVELDPLTNLRYAPVVQVAWGIAEELPEFNAFGGLVPACEDPHLLGILHPSACFPDRAPKGASLLSFFLGGMRSPEIIHWSDVEILSLVQERASRLLGISSSPILQRIFRHPLAIPQYEASSGARFEQIKLLERRYRGLHLGGALCDGIGIPDRIKQAYRIAEEIRLSN